MAADPRLTRSLKGIGAAFVASSTAVASHVLAGGLIPDPIILGLLAVLAMFVCVVLAHVKQTLFRLASSVVVSQAMFHWLFSTMTASPAQRPVTSSIAADSMAASHHAMHSMPASVMSDPATVSMSHSMHSPAMLAAHTVAAVITVVLLYRSEKIAATFSRLIGLLCSFVLTVIVATPIVERQLSREPSAQPVLWRSQTTRRSPVLQRGPPAPAL